MSCLIGVSFNYQTSQSIRSLFIAGISCGVPPAVNNTAEVPQIPVSFEGTYTYSCLAGYETSDPLTTQCQSDGSWSLTTPPTCNSE